jgi:phenylalanyl-tRNA synthetase beta chain
VRSVSNVVDVTNYMLHGYGQPMHAFDVARLQGPAVQVRRAHAGERLTTLDGTERTLDGSMLVIADAARAQAIAGVMGGRESEITADTTDLFLEVASFSPTCVRATRRALDASTDAAYRFERLVPPTSPAETYAWAIQLLLALAGGEVVGTPVLVGPQPTAPPRITVRSGRVAQVLGVPVPPAECAALLSSVGFATAVRHADVEAVPPTWRTDARTEIDLVEEVARLRGYDSFPDALRPYRLGTVPDDPLVTQTALLREMLVGRGFVEVRPMPFVAAAASNDRAVRVTNPLADTEAYLRGDILSSLGRRAEFNLSHMEGDLRLFEIGTVFLADRGHAQPREEVRVAALCMGARRPPHFTDPNPPAWDEWDAKALGEAIAQLARPAETCELEPIGADGKLWRISASGVEIGQVVRVALDAPPWATPAFGAEVMLAVTETAPVAPPGAHADVSDAGARALAHPPAGVTPRYRSPPSQPAVRVDVTLLVPDTVTAAAVEGSLRKTRDRLLERIELTSEYRGPSVPGGQRSVTWRLTFRHPERTLREKEVEAQRDKLLRALESDLGVRQRTV